MGDGDDRAVVLAEEPFEPFHALGVEVVGRLVEEEQVRVLQQQAGEGDATLLTAGQDRDVLIVGQRSASIAMSTLRSRFQASAALMRSSSAACSAPMAS